MKRIPLLQILTLTALGMILSPSATAAEFTVAGVKFDQPAAWKKIATTSSMRQAQFDVPGKEGAKGEVIFYYFGPGGAGGVQANVERWLGQFQEPKDQINAAVENKKVGETRITYVQAEGTYLSGMPGGPKTALKNHKLIGAIVEGAEGFIFIRFTGPKDLANAASADFRKMVEGKLK